MSDQFFFANAPYSPYSETTPEITLVDDQVQDQITLCQYQQLAGAHKQFQDAYSDYKKHKREHEQNPFQVPSKVHHVNASNQRMKLELNKVEAKTNVLKNKDNVTPDTKRKLEGLLQNARNSM